VVAPDLRGFGDIEKTPPARNSGATAETFADDLLGLMDALGFDRIALVSGDVGAYASMVFARKCPERLRGLFFFCNWPPLGSFPFGRNQQPVGVSLYVGDRKVY
jgi:pimeloyl-ACP methyl ester carboxylesterase